MKLFKRISLGFIVFCLSIVVFLPLSPAHADVSLTGFFIESGEKPYLAAGQTISFSFGDDRAIGTSLDYARVFYSIDNGLNWIPVLELHKEEYQGFGEYGTFKLPIDAAVTSARLRLSTSFTPFIGGVSYPKVDVGPFKIMQPGGASDAVATANADGSVTLTWNDNSNMESYYQINRTGGTGGDKTFYVKNTMDHIGPLTYEDKGTNNQETNLYFYTLFPVIDQFALQEDIKPEAQTAIVLIKARPGILIIKDIIKKSDVIDSIATKLPKNYVKVDKGTILKTMPDIIDSDKISAEIKLPGLPGSGDGDGKKPVDPAGSKPDDTKSGSGTMSGTTALTDEKLEELVKGSSGWAKAELKQAITLNLYIDAVIGNYQQPITREHFAGLAVKLYELLSGIIAEEISPNPFTDTTSSDVLKANKAGIVTGISAGIFAPNATITRQEIAVMLMRTVKAAKPMLVLDTSKKFEAADEAKIASWAVEAVNWALNSNIMSGIGENRIDPTGNTTREQAIVLVKRAYVKLLQ
ncbi:S-layer homology domain-containing protein [Paenibacillus psychroresistens]|uniref:S-layer homology domain-containing protein n=1 Tax=Paenibacillus psychroresistens TaxID=1778678 RepID=UPI0013920524|nr:S-layer homology domain-containing protein [Paenibacillus psychroresistens]